VAVLVKGVLAHHITERAVAATTSRHGPLGTQPLMLELSLSGRHQQAAVAVFGSLSGHCCKQPDLVVC
jgi:hypothetical protein